MNHKISQVLIEKKALKKLKSCKLENQYKKAKQFILEGNFSAVKFKKRKPYKTEKYYFRINKQYRALAFVENNILKIFLIDDHKR